MASDLDAVSIISAKRDGLVLTDEQIDYVIQGFTKGTVADEQMSALAMAIFFCGLNRAETSRWTKAMIDSGQTMDFTDLPRPTVDKHSTGGVGDKISLPLAPLVAACGAAVPQISGRGLGYTGGTLDKLESIPGWRANLNPTQMRAILADPNVAAVICAAGVDLVPADNKLYALRDVTGTVGSISLIASSIMSKKIAEGTGALVLDVKVGSGAFMKELDDARRLAKTMVQLGCDAGVETAALVTAMDTPLGRTAGNALEVSEALEVLEGGGPADVVELTLRLAREMLALIGITDTDPADRLSDGAAMDRWRSMVTAQSGDPNAQLPKAAHSEQVRAESSGVMTRLDANAVGMAVWRLGAGRAQKSEPVQSAAGIEMHVKPGDSVRSGQPILTLHTNTETAIPGALAALDGAWEIGSRAAKTSPLVIERITARDL